jgi:hypothetical protein
MSGLDMPEPPRPFRTGPRVAIIRAARLFHDEAHRATLRNRLAKAAALRAESRRLMKELQS